MCFTLAWIEQLLIDFVIICAVVAIIRLLVPYLLTLIGGSPGGLIARIIYIVLWVVIAIFVIYIIFGLLGCIMHMRF